MVSNLQNFCRELEIFGEHAFLGLLFRVAGQKNRKVAVIKPRHNRIRVGLVAAGFHLFFSEVRRTWSKYSQTRAATQVILPAHLGRFILRSALLYRFFVIVIELRRAFQLLSNASWNF